MKIRSDFVTNSSSSSYVIAYKQEGFDKINDVLNQAPVLKSMAKLFNSLVNQASQTISTEKELSDYIVNYYGYRGQSLEEILSEDEYAKEQYYKTLELLNKGFGILRFSVDYNEEVLCTILGNLDDGENFIMIDRD